MSDPQRSATTAAVRGRTGPSVVSECAECDGVGYLGCPMCLGTGKVVSTFAIHPFVTLGALHEHIGGLQIALGIPFEHLYGDGCGGAIPSPADTTISHLRAIAEYAACLFQQLVLLLPEEHARTEGS